MSTRYLGFIYKDAIDKLEKHFVAPSNASRTAILESLTAFSYVPSVKYLVENLRSFETSAINLIHESSNATIGRAYSPVYKIEESEFFFVKDKIYKKENEGIEFATNEEISALPSSFLGLYSVMNADNVDVKAEKITVFSNRSKVEIFENEKGEVVGKINDKVLPAEGLASSLITSGLLKSDDTVSASQIHTICEAYKNVYELDFIKLLESTLHSDVYTAIFSTASGLSVFKSNPSMNTEELLSFSTVNEARAEILEFIGYDIKEAFSEFLSKEEAALNEMKVAQKEIFEKINHLETELAKINEAIKDEAIASNEEVIKIKALLESELSTLKANYSEINEALTNGKIISVNEGKKKEEAAKVEDSNDDEDEEEGKGSTEDDDDVNEGKKKEDPKAVENAPAKMEDEDTDEDEDCDYSIDESSDALLADLLKNHSKVSNKEEFDSFIDEITSLDVDTITAAQLYKKFISKNKSAKDFVTNFENLKEVNPGLTKFTKHFGLDKEANQKKVKAAIKVNETFKENVYGLIKLNESETKVSGEEIVAEYSELDKAAQFRDCCITIINNIHDAEEATEVLTKVIESDHNRDFIKGSKDCKAILQLFMAHYELDPSKANVKVINSLTLNESNINEGYKIGEDVKIISSDTAGKIEAVPAKGLYMVLTDDGKSIEVIEDDLTSLDSEIKKAVKKNEEDGKKEEDKQEKEQSLDESLKPIFESLSNRMEDVLDFEHFVYEISKKYKLEESASMLNALFNEKPELRNLVLENEEYTEVMNTWTSRYGVENLEEFFSKKKLNEAEEVNGKATISEDSPNFSGVVVLFVPLDYTSSGDDDLIQVYTEDGENRFEIEKRYLEIDDTTVIANPQSPETTAVPNDTEAIKNAINDLEVLINSKYLDDAQKEKILVTINSLKEL